MGAVVDKAIEKFEQESQAHKFGGLVISSMRHPAEADRMHEHRGSIVWVDAAPQVRYNRIYSRGQGDKDKKTFEQFLAEEQREMTHSGDEATLNWQAVKEKADIFITNDGSLDDFKSAARKALNL